MSKHSEFLRPLSTTLIIIAICCSLYGCRGNPRTIWSKESRSSDGLWVAAAQTDQYSGPGNAGLYTSVELKRTRGRRDATQVLLFDFNSVTPDKATVELNWLAPTHLEVTYGGNAILDFQAVKCAGIDISVRDISSHAASDNTSN